MLPYSDVEVLDQDEFEQLERCILAARLRSETTTLQHGSFAEQHALHSKVGGVCHCIRVAALIAGLGNLTLPDCIFAWQQAADHLPGDGPAKRVCTHAVLASRLSAAQRQAASPAARQSECGECGARCACCAPNSLYTVKAQAGLAQRGLLHHCQCRVMLPTPTACHHHRHRALQEQQEQLTGWTAWSITRHAQLSRCSSTLQALPHAGGCPARSCPKRGAAKPAALARHRPKQHRARWLPVRAGPCMVPPDTHGPIPTHLYQRLTVYRSWCFKGAPREWPLGSVHGSLCEMHACAGGAA